ncbi:MAG: hypothetical protein H6545_07030 [Bacteroidales bacterium]|nr:hypothetical protein [Bacteroidales bacterium]
MSDGTVEKAEKLVAQMTLDEKIGQMSQLDIGFFRDQEQLKQAVRDGRCGSLLNFLGTEKVNELQRIAVEESRLGIPLIIGRDVIHGYRTVFPIPLGMAASWNPEAVRQAFRISAIEASSHGIRWSFSPMIDITWDPRWGRIAEGCGEDPFSRQRLLPQWSKGCRATVSMTRHPWQHAPNTMWDTDLPRRDATITLPGYPNPCSGTWSSNRSMLRRRPVHRHSCRLSMI